MSYHLPLGHEACGCIYCSSAWADGLENISLDLVEKKELFLLNMPVLKLITKILS